MDKQAFKQRMQNLKSYRENNPGKGYWDWRNSLPDNLKYTDDTEYDMVGAYNSGAQPTFIVDSLNKEQLARIETRDGENQYERIMKNDKSITESLLKSGYYIGLQILT